MTASVVPCNQNAILSKRSTGEDGICSGCLIDFPSGLIIHGGERLCPLCDAPHHLHAGRGTMIWLPSMTQSALNVMCLTVFCGVYASKKTGDVELLGKFVELIEDLERLALVLENNYLGELRNSFKEGSNPLWFSQVIDHLKSLPSSQNQATLDGVRFLPDYIFFAPVLKPWFDHFLQSNPLDSWKDSLVDNGKSLDYQA